MTECDVVIIGGGIAGAAAGYALAVQHRVVLLEREAQPGYHATGRSAALFTEAYGNKTIRALTKASRAFFTAPPSGFAAHPLLTPRGAMVIARADQKAALDDAFAEARHLVESVVRVDVDAACRTVPVLRREYFAHAFLEPDAMDIDVHALHRGYLRGITGAGGRVVSDAEVTALSCRNGCWHVQSRAGAFIAPVVINAAGAWCDEVAALAGVPPIGLVPKRRTAITFDPPTAAVHDWPMVLDVDEQFYFKPDAGRLLASPADETPMPPCDVQPDELDLAILIDRLEQATTLTVKRIAAKWAGLRSFVADKTLVAGFEPGMPGFFWLAGQGGYGIQTSPAMARVAASLIAGRGLPDDLVDRGIGEASLSPARFRG